MSDDHDYVRAADPTQALWVCRVCGAPVIVVVGDVPTRKRCSGEFGRFTNVTSSELQAQIERLRP